MSSGAFRWRARIGDGLVPSLPIEMLRVALHAGAVRLFVDGPVVESIAVGDFVVPTEDDGELRIYYSRRDSHRSVSAIDVLDGKVDPLRFEHKLVLIGTTGLAVADYQNTPLGVRMPGSEIQAQVLENLFDQTWLDAAALGAASGARAVRAVRIDADRGHAALEAAQRRTARDGVHGAAGRRRRSSRFFRGDWYSTPPRPRWDC